MSGDDRVRLDPASLRVVAHPLRVRILGLLRQDGPATSTALAGRLGISSGATGHHLRQLAAYGFVVEEPGRRWRAAHQSTVLDRETLRRAPADAEAYLRAVAATYAETTARWLGESQVLPDEWRAGSTLSSAMLRLTPAEAAGLRAELIALVERYRPYAEPDPPQDAELVEIQVQLMPFVRPDDDG